MIDELKARAAVVRVQFTIPGKPFAKQRPRATRQGRVYTPAATVSFERQVGQIAATMFSAPMAGPVRLTVEAYFPIPPSWSKRRQAEAVGAWHVQKPDVDNVVKAICDGLNRIAWADDGQVAEVVARKRWAAGTGQAVVTVEPI